MNLPISKLTAFLGLIACFSLQICHALPSDREQEISIASDKASLNKIQGELIYSGNVELIQGSLSIQADKVILTRNQEGLQKLVAHGKPARYEQRLSESEDKTHAYGETIIYNIVSDELTLLTNAGLEKQGNVFAGERIVYLIQEQRVKADSTEQERVRMVIQPKANKEP